MIETSYSELLVIAMKNNLKQACKKGVYDVEMVHNNEAMHGLLRAYAIVKGQKVLIGEMVFNDMLDHSMSWKELGDFTHVNDTMKATLMLLYGDLTS